MAIGYINVRVTTSRALYPLEDAFVSVTKNEQDKVSLLGFRVTDKDGKTETIIVETPDIELSQQPNNSNSFTSCNIRIDHPQYYSLIINDVQIFAENITLQEVELIPLEENATINSRIKSINIPAQNL